MKLKVKLFLAPSIILIIFVLTGLVIYGESQNFVRAINIYENKVGELTSNSNMQISLERIRRSIGEIIVGEERTDDFDNAKESFENNYSSALIFLKRDQELHEKYFSTVEELSSVHYQKIKDDFNKIAGDADNIMDQYHEGKLEEVKELYEQIDVSFNKFDEELEEYKKEISAHVVKDKNLVASSENKLKLALTFSIFLSILFGFLLSLLSAHFITRSLAKVQNAVSEILKGDLNKRVTNTSKDEVGELARAFNEMVDKLQTSYSILDLKVKERTAELEKIKNGLEETISDKTKMLQEKIKELEYTNQVMMGREIKIIELKNENAALRKAQSKKNSQSK